MSQRRQHSSSRSARAAPAGDVLPSPARQTRSSSRLADSSEPPVTRSKTLQSSTLSRSSRLARRNSAPVKSLVPAKSAVTAATTRDASRDPVATPVRTKSAQRRSRHGSAPPELQGEKFRPLLDPVPEVSEVSPASSPGPSAPTHAEHGAVSGPLDGREANSPKGFRRLNLDDPEQDAAGDDSAGTGSNSPADDLSHHHRRPLHDADNNNLGIHGERESLHFSPTSGPANERADALMRDLLDEADHDDRLVSDHGDLGGDISPPATLGDLCEQESFSSPNPGPGNGRADASMMVDMAPSSRLSRGEGMQDSGPCSPSGVPGSPGGSITDFHHAGSVSQDSSLLPNPPTPSLPPPSSPPIPPPPPYSPDASPSARLEAHLRPRGLQMVDTGGRGNCFFTSVIASVQHAAFLPAGSQLLRLLSTGSRCSVLRAKIYEKFMMSPNDIRFRAGLDESAWAR